MNIAVRVEKIKVDESALIQAALPEGCSVQWKIGEKYQILAGMVLAAFAIVANGQVIFEIEPGSAGDYFKSLLIAKFPESEPDRIFWVVIHGWHNGWTYSGKPENVSRGEALSSIGDFEVQNGAYLCSFRSQDWHGTGVTTLTSYRIWDLNTTGADEGPKTVGFTSLEAFHIPAPGCLDV